ncbi:hypothetical protein R3P38DRAFT_1727405 [Favolaschia claudopus]|uniref:F-box domain-containing protein n=1 Tax=Favolaschia claudopus TaxID=2862362 RepID=A0AAW0AA74_9AGAR
MQSPFVSRLHTNYCASDDEIPELKELLVQPRLRLAKLDGEILALRQKLDGLVDERESLETYIQSHKALMSPIRRIPLDLLEQIFIACLPAHRNCVMSAQEAPVLLGRICSSWRTLSLSAPRLWSRLHIVLPPPDHESLSRDRDIFAAKTAQRLEVASTWLGRTGNCPLSISVERDFHMNHLDLPEDLLELLIPYASRWQHLSLVLPPSGFERLSRLSENDVPLLMSLSMSSAPIMDPAYTWTPAGILFAPNLSSFEFAGSGIIPSALPLRWNTLTELSLRVSSWNLNSGLTCEMALDILARCHALRSCQLLIQEISESQVLPTNPIVPCSFLRAFELQCYKTPLRTTEYLLNHFSHLALEEFSLYGSHTWEDCQDVQGITSALLRLTCLRSIVLQVGLSSKLALGNFLRGLPSTIKCLKLMNATEWNILDVLNDEALQIFEASPLVCPALQEFTIADAQGITDEALLHFIVSRSPTLRLVDITFSRERQVDILLSLHQFIEAGLEISLSYLPRKPAYPQFSPWQGLPDAPSYW